jgi:metallopeptidase MepB
MLESWCWIKEELKEISCHYTRLNPQYLLKWQEENPGAPCPPEKIPYKMVDDLIKGRARNRALWFFYQLQVPTCPKLYY